jgi:hypothetical protein
MEENNLILIVQQIFKKYGKTDLNVFIFVIGSFFFRIEVFVIEFENYKNIEEKDVVVLINYHLQCKMLHLNLNFSSNTYEILQYCVLFLLAGVLFYFYIY